MIKIQNIGVIPAKAGIYPEKYCMSKMDSRLRGNDTSTLSDILRKIFLTLLIFTTFLFPIHAAEPNHYSTPYSFTSTEDASRFDTLTRQIRCVVCQHQNIAESSTPIAESLRRKVYQLIIEKKSDNEIKEYLVKRYGEYILLNPRMSSRTILLWAFPFLGLLIGAIVLFLLFRKKK